MMITLCIMVFLVVLVVIHMALAKGHIKAKSDQKKEMNGGRVQSLDKGRRLADHFLKKYKKGGIRYSDFTKDDIKAMEDWCAAAKSNISHMKGRRADEYKKQIDEVDKMIVSVKSKQISEDIVSTEYAPGTEKYRKTVDAYARYNRIREPYYWSDFGEGSKENELLRKYYTKVQNEADDSLNDVMDKTLDRLGKKPDRSTIDFAYEASADALSGIWQVAEMNPIANLDRPYDRFNAKYSDYYQANGSLYVYDKKNKGARIADSKERKEYYKERDNAYKDILKEAEDYLKVKHCEYTMDNYLMHYGIKGMKWKKRKKKGMSDYEHAGRNYESALRSEHQAYSNYRDADDEHRGAVFFKNAHEMGYGNLDNAWDDDRKVQVSKEKRSNALRNLRYASDRSRKQRDNLKKKTPKMDHSKKAVSKRVKAYNRKHKVKTFISNLFKKG